MSDVHAKTGKRAFPLLLLLLSLGLTLVVGEVFMRVLLGSLPVPFLVYLHPEQKNRHPEVWERISLVNPWTQGRAPHPVLEWTFKPDRTYEGQNEDGEHYSLKTNSLGFFSPDEPEPSEKQLVSLGDSFMSTFYVREPLPWALRRKIDLPVFNLAVGGWGIEQYRRAYELYGHGRNAPIVAVFSFNNDITDVDNWRRWEASGSKLGFLDWIWNENPTDEVNNADSWLDRNSVLWNFLKFVYLHLIRMPGGDPAGKADSSLTEVRVGPAGDGEKLDFVFNPGYSFLYLEPREFQPGGSYWKYMSAYFDALLKLRESIHRSGAQMVLIWIPAKERVYIPLLPREEYRKFVSNASGRIDGMEVSISGFAREHGIPFLDLTEGLMQHARAGRKLYFTVDGHLNSLGNRLAGEMAGEFIQKFIQDDEK